LEQTELVRACQQQREIADGDALRRGVGSLDKNALFVQCQIQGSLIHPLDFVGLVDEDNVLVPGRQKQAVEVGHAVERLSQDFMEIGRHFPSDDGCQGTLA
jgi:hypothetical protein